MPAHNDSPEYLEDRIAETRARFDRHASALSASLAPDRLLNDAIGARSDAPADTLDALVQTARTAPVSFLLAGIGLAGILMNNRKRPVMPEHPLPVGTDPAERTGEHIHALKAQARSVAEDAGEAAGALQDKAAGLVAGAAAGVSEMGTTTAAYADAAYRSGVAGYRISRNHAAHYVREAPGRGAQLAGDAGSWVRDNPVTAGLAALALGAAAASFLAYRREDGPFEDHEDFPPSPDPRVQGIPAPTARKVAGKRPASPDVGSAIPNGKSKIGRNVIASTSVLGVDDGEMKD